MDAFHWFTAERATTLVAVAALAGLLYAARSAESARESASSAKDQVAAARDQVDVAREQTDLLLRQVQQGELAETQRKIAERDALQPAVVVSLQQGRSDPSVLVLVVENIGKSTARNVRITPSTELIRSDGKKIHEWRVFTGPISVMPPGHRLQYLVDTGAGVFDGQLPLAFSFAVEAEGPNGELPTATYDVDLEALRDVWIGETSFHTLVEEIKRTNRGLQDVKEAIRKLDPEYKAWLRRDVEAPRSREDDAITG